jgi:peroxiredoxin Q/BCP
MISRLRRALCLLLPGSAVLRAGSVQAATPEVGQMAPDFELPDQQGKVRRLADWRGKWLVLYFYPKDDTPGCTTEACNFRDDWLKLQALGAEVAGISVDTSSAHQAFAQKYKLPFPLLADDRAEVAARYGALSDWVLFKFAKRYTFVIEPQGRIAKVYRSVDTDRHSAEILADLQRLQQGMPQASAPSR